jgi:flagellar M-ring protein FliF
VLVPVAEIARARVALAKDGLPVNGRPGLELFDKPSWGMTDFTQRVTYQRALEGELARTVAGIRGVSKAQVHLVIPSPSPLRKLDRPASASVVLTLRPGTVLPGETIQGITYIVANSVEHLASDNVAVMDDSGHLLSVPSGNGSLAGMTSWQLEMQRSIEQSVVEKIEVLLAPLVGAERTRAQVSAELSFDQTDRTVETFDPDAQVLENEQRSETEPGTDAGAQTVVNNSYQNSRRVEKSVSSVGKIQRLTAAVLVDQAALTANPGGQPIRLAELEAMLRDAVGIVEARGDRLTVLAVPFGTLPEGEAAAAAGGGGGVTAKPAFDLGTIFERFLKPVIGLLAIVVLALLGLKALRGNSSPAGAAAAGGAGAARLAGPDGEALLLREGGASVAAGGERPEATVEVLRHWLHERGSGS